MAKAKKLPSGSWHISVYDFTNEQGKRFYRSFTADTKAEVEYLAADFVRSKKKRTKQPSKITVSEAIDKYIAISEFLSPTTLQGYQKIQRTAFQDIMNAPVDRLTDDIMQKAINNEARRIGRYGRPISPKTVKNNYGLLSSALKSSCNLQFSIKLPKVQHKNKVLPEPEQIIQAIKGTKVELPCMLAMWMSFSMSELRGIKCSSVKDGYISIDQVVVDIGNMPVIKNQAKVDTRIRKQQCPEYIMQLIRSTETFQNYLKTNEDCLLINCSAYDITNRYKRIMRLNGLSITFHDLRHVFASVMLNELNIPEKIVQEEGGWKTPHIMKSVYSNTFTDSRKKADELRDNYFINAIQVCNTNTENS